MQCTTPPLPHTKSLQVRSTQGSKLLMASPAHTDDTINDNEIVLRLRNKTLVSRFVYQYNFA